MTTLPTAVATSRLLVVEDDDSIRETVGEALRSEGYEVLTCADGSEALGLLTVETSQSVDLIVLDLMLPGLGGLDLCRELRRFNNNTPILVISARDSETDRVLGLEVGATITREALWAEELVARCRALLRRSRQTPEQPSRSTATPTFAFMGVSAGSPVMTRSSTSLPRSTRFLSCSSNIRNVSGAEINSLRNLGH